MYNNLWLKYLPISNVVLTPWWCPRLIRPHNTRFLFPFRGIVICQQHSLLWHIVGIVGAIFFIFCPSNFSCLWLWHDLIENFECIVRIIYFIICQLLYDSINGVQDETAERFLRNYFCVFRGDSRMFIHSV